MTKTMQETELQPLELAETNSNHRPPESDKSTRLRLPSRKWLIGGGIAAAATVGLLTLSGSGTDSSADTAADAGPVNTTEVIVADLVQEVSLDGTLGSVAGEPLLASSAGIVTAVAPAGTTVSESEALFRVNNEPVVLLYGDSPAYRDLTLGVDSIAISSAGTGVITDLPPAGSIIQQGDVVYWVDGQPVVALYGTTPMYRTLQNLSTDLVGSDVAQLEAALADLGFDLGESLTVDNQFTYGTQLAVQEWQESLGVEIDGVVRTTDVVFIPGPSQVVEYAVAVGESVAPGREVALLSTGAALASDDVAQLEQALGRLGFDADGEMVADGVFSVETQQAIVDWQTSVGQNPDGVINLGEVVFLPSSVKISEQLASPGAVVNAGVPIAAVSSEEPVVRVEIPAADQGVLEIGDAVTVVLPGFEEVPATVKSISTTASVTQDGAAYFEAIVELNDPSAAAGLDEAPVTVDVAGDSVTGATVVPVTALVALAEGSYAVQVQTATGLQFVAVEPGFFADGLVEVSSDGLSVGDTVTLP